MRAHRTMPMHIGTAGWSISRDVADAFPGEGQHLARYARVLNAAEINSSFYGHHRRELYERWAAQTPPEFRFAAKLPRSITHEGRLRRARSALEQFAAETAGLGDRLAVVLVQFAALPAFRGTSHPQFLHAAGRAFHRRGGVRTAPCQLVHRLGRRRAGAAAGVSRGSGSGALARGGTARRLAGSARRRSRRRAVPPLARIAAHVLVALRQLVAR